MSSVNNQTNTQKLAKGLPVYFRLKSSSREMLSLLTGDELKNLIIMLCDYLDAFNECIVGNSEIVSPKDFYNGYIHENKDRMFKGAFIEIATDCLADWERCVKKSKQNTQNVNSRYKNKKDDSNDYKPSGNKFNDTGNRSDYDMEAMEKKLVKN